METKELNNTLRERARELGLCDKWYKEWDKNSTKRELIEKFINGIDFCIEHDFPNIDFARENFPKILLLEYGIFLDDNIDASNLTKAVALGNSHGEFRYDGLSTGDIYVRHQSDIRITAQEGARVFVEVYDGARLQASADKFSKIFVYDHGGVIKTEGNVTVRDKRKAEN